LLLLKAFPHSSHLYFFIGGALNGFIGRLLGMPSADWFIPGWPNVEWFIEWINPFGVIKDGCWVGEISP